MTAHTPTHASAGQGIYAAFVSLALTQRRLAHGYRREALEAEAHGDLDRYHTCRSEANRLWDEAKWHLNHSRCWRR